MVNWYIASRRSACLSVWFVCLSTYLVGVSSTGVEGMRLKMLMEVSESVILWNHNITISCLKANLPALLWKATNVKCLKCSAGFKGCVGRIYV